ncbi:MAG TPA: YfhO family protein, partial [Thermoleophilaceae bacterium]|nr:YfhO family protein [Thermoleophilaceae bacterium]
ALLAGWGLDELSGKDLAGRSRRKLALGLAGAIFIFPVVWMLVAGTIEPSKLGPALKVAWGFKDPPLNTVAGAAESAAAPVVRMNALLQWLPLAGAGLVLIALRLQLLRGRRWALPAGAFVALAVAVLAVDLFRANMGFNPSIPLDKARQPTTGAIKYLQGRVPNRFAGMGPLDNTQVLSPDLAMRYGLYDARGYDYPVERRYDSLWRGTAGPEADLVPSTTRAQETAESLRTLSLLSVSDVMQDPAGKRLNLPGLSVAYDGPDARVYRNANALPRVFLVDRQRTVQGKAAARAAVTSPTFDARRVAVTERPVAGLARDGGGGGASASASPGSARLASYGRERAVVSTSARRRSLLVLTDAHYPGWKARVDGRSAKIERVNYMLRGVSLPAGSHRVEFTYEPSSWRVGWIVSLLSLIALVVLVVIGLRRRGGERAVSA